MQSSLSFRFIGPYLFGASPAPPTASFSTEKCSGRYWKRHWEAPRRQRPLDALLFAELHMSIMHQTSWQDRMIAGRSPAEYRKFTAFKKKQYKITTLYLQKLHRKSRVQTWQAHSHQGPNNRKKIFLLPSILFYSVRFSALSLSNLSKRRPCNLPFLACRYAFFTYVYVIQMYCKLTCNVN